jgi:hypothetical protein
MVTGLIVLVLVTVAVTGFILDGYRAKPRWTWGRVNGYDPDKRMPLTRLTRWVLGSYVVLCTLLLIPDIREQVSEPQRFGLLIGFVALLIATGFMDDLASKRSPYKHKRRSALSWEEKHVLRRERKQQRLRQARAHRKR